MAASVPSSLTVFVPKGGCAIWMPLAIGARELPEKLHRHKVAVLNILGSGGTLRIKDAESAPNHVLGKDLGQWRSVFPGLQMRLAWDSDGGIEAGAVEANEYGERKHRTLSGDPAITVAELEKITGTRSIQDIVEAYRFMLPTVDVGEQRAEFEA